MALPDLVSCTARCQPSATAYKLFHLPCLVKITRYTDNFLSLLHYRRHEIFSLFFMWFYMMPLLSIFEPLTLNLITSKVQDNKEVWWSCKQMIIKYFYRIAKHGSTGFWKYINYYPTWSWEWVSTLSYGLVWDSGLQQLQYLGLLADVAVNIT